LFLKEHQFNKDDLIIVVGCGVVSTGEINTALIQLPCAVVGWRGNAGN